MEEQAPFCSACGAPQIKVTVQQEDQTAPSADAPASSLHSETHSQPATADTAAHWVDTGNQIQWRTFFRIAVPFGLANGLVTLFLGPVGWFITLPGSVLWCIVLYRRRFPGPLSAGRGARMGCAVGFLSFTTFAVLFICVYCLTGELRPLLNEAVQQAATRNSDPNYQRTIHFFSQSTTGMVVFVVLGLTFVLFLFLSFGSAAGALTGVLSGVKSKR